MYSRRDFGKIALAGVPFAAALAKINSTVKGVRLGVQTYSFRDFNFETFADRVSKNMADLGLGECELQFPRLSLATEERKRAASTPLSYYKDAGKAFKDAGIDVVFYNANFGTTDEEFNREFEIAKAVGAQMMASSCKVSTARRVVPFAEKHMMIVALHGHSDIKDADAFATPESFRAALAMSKYYRTNLDIGHFTAANFDAVAYIQEHHDKITHIHLKDRKKDQGLNTNWGEGDAPIKQVLQLLRDKKYQIPAYIEYEYKGTGPSPEEVKKCFEYSKAALR